MTRIKTDATTDRTDKSARLPESAEALAEGLARSGRRWGIWARDVPPLVESVGPAAVAAAMKDVQALGGEVLGLTSIRQASATLDPGELREVGAEAARQGVELQVNLGTVHPDRYDAAEGEAAIDAGAKLGVGCFHATFGVVADRFAITPTWTEQLRSAVDPMRALVDRAGRALVMRTHEEMTTFELMRLCESVGRDDLRVGYSPVNVVTRLEDPDAAFRRVADRTSTLFLDDYVISRTAAGAARRLCLLGEGVIGWERLIADSPPDAVTLLDIHHAEFDMPFYDPEWLVHQPDLNVGEFVDVLRPSSETDPGQIPFQERRAHGRRLLARATSVGSGTTEASVG